MTTHTFLTVTFLNTRAVTVNAKHQTVVIGMKLATLFSHDYEMNQEQSAHKITTHVVTQWHWCLLFLLALFTILMDDLNGFRHV